MEKPRSRPRDHRVGTSCATCFSRTSRGARGVQWRRVPSLLAARACFPLVPLPPSPFPLPPSARPASPIALCQALGPAAPYNICGVDCAGCPCCQYRGWEQMRAIAWQTYAQGEYVGHARFGARARVPHPRGRSARHGLPRDPRRKAHALPVERRRRDQDRVIYRPRVEPLAPDPARRHDHAAIVGPGPRDRPDRRAAPRRPRGDVQEKYYKVPAITVTPLRVNSKLEDLRATVDRRAGVGGQSQLVRVSPEGTISLPAIGFVMAQGLDARGASQGTERAVSRDGRGHRGDPRAGRAGTPLRLRAGRGPHARPLQAYRPDHYPSSACGMAGSWNVGANLCQVVVFRRGDDLAPHGGDGQPQRRDSAASSLAPGAKSGSTTPT